MNDLRNLTCGELLGAQHACIVAMQPHRARTRRPTDVWGQSLRSWERILSGIQNANFRRHMDANGDLMRCGADCQTTLLDGLA